MVADPGRGYAGAMVHLRIVVAADRTEKVLELLEATPRSATSSSSRAPRASRPATWSSATSRARTPACVIDDLKELGVHRDGSIALEQIDSQISDAAKGAERAAPGSPSDAVVWEEVEARTSETTELGGNFLAFMVARLPDRLGRDLHRLADPDRRGDGRRAGVRPAGGPLRGDRRAAPRRRPALADRARRRLPDRHHRRLPVHPDLPSPPASSTPTSRASTTR